MKGYNANLHYTGGKMEDHIYITGHRNPDTDSICSAIAYAEYKNKTGINAIPARLGELNMETEFVLKFFGVEVPDILHTVKTQVSDLMMDTAHSIAPSISIKTAWSIMKRNNVKTLPIVDENDRFLGIATLSDITNKLMDALDNNIIATSNTPLLNLVETLSARLLYGSQENFKTSGKIVITAINPDEMTGYVEPGDIVIAGNRKETAIKAIELGANCIIMTCGAKIDDDLLEAVKENLCILMVTQSDTFTTARLINQSVPVGYMMTGNNIVKFDPEDFIEEIKDKMLVTRYRSYPVVDSRNHVMGLISRFHLISPMRKKVILVDHNERSQTVKGIEEAEIIEIIDHHKLGDIQTMAPIFFKNEPVGCTSTIIAQMFFESGIMPSKKSAGIMCAAIISDTLNFKSPTSTYTDRMIADKLAEIANLPIDDFAVKMFKAGSTLHGKSPEEIINNDFKEFKAGKYTIGISQVYTMDYHIQQEEIYPQLVEFMEKYCAEHNYSLLILLVTDVMGTGSEMLFAGEEIDLVAKAFKVDIQGNCIYLPEVVSRKKQVIPALSVILD